MKRTPRNPYLRRMPKNPDAPRRPRTDEALGENGTLPKGFGDEHGGYLIDAENEHTVADPDELDGRREEHRDGDESKGPDSGKTGRDEADPADRGSPEGRRSGARIA